MLPPLLPLLVLLLLMMMPLLPLLVLLLPLLLLLLLLMMMLAAAAVAARPGRATTKVPYDCKQSNGNCAESWLGSCRQQTEAAGSKQQFHSKPVHTPEHVAVLQDTAP
jgi:hypothetical protein